MPEVYKEELDSRGDSDFAYANEFARYRVSVVRQRLGIEIVFRVINTHVRTMDELGFPNFDYSGFVGLAAPAKTPPAIVAFLNKELNAVVQSQPFRERMEALGMTVPADNTPEKLADLLRRETVRQAALAKLSGHAPLAPQR